MSFCFAATFPQMIKNKRPLFRMFYSRPIKIDRENSLRGCCYMKVIGWGHYGGCTGTQDIEV